MCPPGRVTTPRLRRHQCSHCLLSCLDARCTQRDILSSAFNSSLHSPYPIFIDCICTFRTVNDRADARNLTLSVPLRLAWVNPSDFQGKIELHGGQRRRTVISCNIEHGVRGGGFEAQNAPGLRRSKRRSERQEKTKAAFQSSSRSDIIKVRREPGNSSPCQGHLPPI